MMPPDANPIAGPGGPSGGWFVGFTKPRQEHRAAENLMRQGFDCRLPLVWVRRRSRRDLGWEQEAMFPRYVFLRPTECAAPLDRVRSTYGMSGLVRFAGLPATIADSVVMQLLAVGGSLREELFQKGDRVRFEEGPLEGLEGVFDCPDGEDRAFVLIEFLQRTQRLLAPMQSLVATG